MGSPKVSTSLIDRKNRLNLNEAEARVLMVARHQISQWRPVKAVGPWLRPETSERHRRSA